MISARKFYEDLQNKGICNPLLMSVVFRLPKYIKKHDIMDILQTLKLAYINACFFFFFIPFQINIHYHYQCFISFVLEIEFCIREGG